MNVLKCLAVDDEPHALELLVTYCDRVPYLHLAHTTTSPWDALNILETEHIDILFLDVQMDELTGLQLLDIGKISCAIILTTAYTNYALDGFDYDVQDYLLKPYSFDRFLKAVSKARKRNEAQRPEDMPLRETVHPDKHIFIKGDAKNKYHQVKLSDIHFIEGLKNYVQFCCKDQKIIALQNMKDIEQYLPTNQFIRVHRSYIVNLDAIDKIDGHMIQIAQKIIGIGPTYRSQFYAAVQSRGL